MAECSSTGPGTPSSQSPLFQSLHGMLGEDQLLATKMLADCLLHCRLDLAARAVGCSHHVLDGLYLLQAGEEHGG